MKLTDEYRVIDDARKLLKYSVGATPCTIELSENAVYINSMFFQLLKKQQQKDNSTEFEENRDKRVEKHLSA